MRAERVSVAVVGGGITGLAAMHRACELFRARGRVPPVVLLESSERLGGQIWTESDGARLIEGGPDSFLVDKPAAVALCERLGLGGELVRLDASGHGTRILHRGRLHRTPPGFVMVAPTRLRSLASSTLFSLRGKLRMALEPLLPARTARADESLASFVARRFGREVLDRVAEPVLASLFMGDARRLSLNAVLPRLAEMERVHGSVTRGIRRGMGAAAGRPHGNAGGFAYLAGGMLRLVERILERSPEATVRTDAVIRAIHGDEGSWRIRLRDSADVVADALVLACPAEAVSVWLEGVDHRLSAGLARLAYVSCATVNLSYRRSDVGRPLDGLGFFVPRTEGRRILAASFASVKFVGRAPADEALVRCFLGGALHPQLEDVHEHELCRIAHEELAPVLGIRGRPVAARAVRFPRSMPQYEVGFPERLRALLHRIDAHPGLFLAGSTVGAVGLPDCIRSGETAGQAAFAVATAPRTAAVAL